MENTEQKQRADDMLMVECIKKLSIAPPELIAMVCVCMAECLSDVSRVTVPPPPSSMPGTVLLVFMDVVARRTLAAMAEGIPEGLEQFADADLSEAQNILNKFRINPESPTKH